ncbi:MAG: GLPGLI family protein [Dysgonamonadaceae bacterium]|jgi:GLPGLI family protein|nr:GLPGLI family protein [Dysgonamonadaceae bacterium]
MKLKFFPLIIIFVPMFAYSQIIVRTGNTAIPDYETLDTAVLKILYEAKSSNDKISLKDDTTSTRLQTDYMVLEFGAQGVSRFYSDNRRRMDSLMNELIKINPSKINLTKDVLDKNGISSNGLSLEVYKNYPNGKITVTDDIGNSSYRYEESMIDIQWQITSDTMTCLNYLCQKAVCDFRGRHYEAWFAPDLPVNDGPMKFSGLPGLILNISDSDHLFVFKAIGLETTTFPILFPQKNYLKASRKEVEKVKRKSVEDPIGFITNSMPGTKVTIKFTDENGIEKSPDEMKFQYNPMELE